MIYLSIRWRSRNNYELSDYGLDIKNKIEALFVGAEDLGGNVKNNPQRTDESSNPIGTRMFLLKPEDEIILNKFSEEIHKLTMKMVNKNQSDYMQSV